MNVVGNAVSPATVALIASEIAKTGALGEAARAQALEKAAAPPAE